MIYKKLFLCLTGLVTLLSIGANIFLYQKVNELSDKLALNKVAKEEAASPSIPDAVRSLEKVVKNSNIRDINELEYQLNAAEEELDMANELLAELLEKNNTEAKPEEIQKASMLNNMKQGIDRDYALLYRRLDLSPEDLDGFKRIVLDWRLANRERVRLRQENRDKYNQEFIDLMGEEKYLIYDGLKKSGSQRNELKRFTANMPPENRISDDDAEDFIYGMYQSQKIVKNETNLGDIYNSSDSDYVKTLRMIEMEEQIYEKYVEVSSNILPPDQAELINAQLGKQIEQYEEQKRWILQELEGKKDKADNSVIFD